MVIVKEPDCDVDLITEKILTHVPKAEIESDVSAELSYILPNESKAQFQELFNELDESKSALKISTYGVSVTTMEEVFIKFVWG